MKQDCVLVHKVLASLTSESGILFYFSKKKKWVGQAMGNECFIGMALSLLKKPFITSGLNRPIFCSTEMA